MELKKEALKNCYKAFTITNEAHYFNDNTLEGDCVYEISFGYYSKNGGTIGELFMRWIKIDSKLTFPQLQSFDDSWFVLSQFKYLIDKLAEYDDSRIELTFKPDDFVKILLDFGFENRTRYKYNEKENEEYHKVLNRKRKIKKLI